MKSHSPVFGLWWILFFCVLVSSSIVNAQQTPSPGGQGPQSSSTAQTTSSRSNDSSALERRFAIHFLEDQRDIWTSPLKLKRKDIVWIVPAGVVLGGLIYRDVDAYRGLSVTAPHAATAKTFSDAGVVGLGGVTAGFYLLGVLKKDDHMRETGVVATEAVANSMAVDYVLKYVLGRQRPLDGNGQGRFFQFSSSDSFPSGHAIAAWSIASVIAHEYPGSFTKIGVYGLASAISMMRVTGQQHFSSDVVVGSALGYFIGDYTYRKRHQDDAVYGSFRDATEIPTSLGSPYVPLDSWVYPAFDRLSALGFVHSGMAAMRPWTRLECARLVAEAQAGDDDSNTEASGLIARLLTEFESGKSKTAGMISVDSVYFRTLVVSGPPMTDGYHFGQTVYNDYGRPYEEGFNAITGFTSSASYGRWAFYLQSEYQHAPSAPGVSSTTAAQTAAADFIPTLPPGPVPEIDRARLLDAYFSYTVRDWQFSLGKQSLWWGPGQDGALNLSNNAEPVPMFRISRVTPLAMPWILSWMGPIRGEIFWGQLAGHQFVRTDKGLFGPVLENQPMIEGEKISFKPTPNLEFGFSATNLWGGPGLPLNLHAFFNTYSFGNAQIPGGIGDPGDRRSGFNFSYRLPRLHGLTLYSDSFNEDELSPIAYPRKSSFRSGIYLPSLPRLRKMDFRSEGVYTDIPNLNGNGVEYQNNRFLSGYTNYVRILGDWIGREGSGFTASSSYWFSPVRKASVSYRNANVNPNFIGGGRYDDFAGKVDWEVNLASALSFSVQYERWNFPVLSPLPQKNTSVSATYLLHPWKLLHRD